MRELSPCAGRGLRERESSLLTISRLIRLHSCLHLGELVDGFLCSKNLALALEDGALNV